VTSPRYWREVAVRVYTSLVRRRAMRGCGSGNIVHRPLSATWGFVSMGSGCRIAPGCRIEGVARHAGTAYSPHIVFGDRVSVEQRCTIVAASTLAIGSDTTISYDVTITDLDHQYRAIGTHVLRQPITVRTTSIGPNCFIGAGARILAGTTLGRQCVVGANAVVRGNYPDFSVLTGNPARTVRRYDDLVGKWRRTDEAAL
jgi:acetyltransferase-like isoleucine patch superfamily enzyme